MPKISKEQVEKRKNEILDACDTLYKEMSYHDVTIKDIAAYTSFSRPSIYNYYETIEEIFLGLLEREYTLWNNDLKVLEDKTLTREELASEIAQTLQKRRTLLRIQSNNYCELEDHTRIERLTHFKEIIAETLKMLSNLLKKHLQASDHDILLFNYIFMPFLCGAFPQTEPTQKQCEAMDAAGIAYPDLSIYDLVNNCLLTILPK